MWGGILKKVVLLGWLIDRFLSDIALKALRPMAAAVSKAGEAMLVSVSKAMALPASKEVAEVAILKAVVATVVTEMTTATTMAICWEKSSGM
jgi:hypothetical protein